MKNFKVLSGLVFILGLGGCTHKEVQQREPAAAAAPEIISADEARILAQLIGGDSPVRNYRHPMKASFHTNNDKKYLTETARKALQQALAESLGVNDPEKGFAKIVAGKLKEAIIENFVKTLRVYKIVNTGLQFDLAFAPTPNKPKDFGSELASNQLIRLDEINSLSAKWDQLEKGTFTQSVYNNSPMIPINSQAANYIGGVATVYIELLDANPKFKVPDPTKNAVKGFIRYRRYYRVQQDHAQKVTCDKYTLSSNRAGEDVPTFFTVDLYKNFNLKNLIPTPETIEIYPGIIATTNVGREQLLPSDTNQIGKSIPTASFNVSQKKLIGGDLTITLDKLVYGATDKKIDPSLSEASIKSGGLGLTVDQVKTSFLNDCEQPLAKLLNLNVVLGGAL
jgi:hypothetical protein